MKDIISIERIKLLHPYVRSPFQSFIEDAENSLNITLRIVQGLRTFKEQDDLYAQGRTKPGAIVTNAKGGQSYHNYGLAIDLVEMKGKDANWNFDYKKLITFSNKYKLEWGGTWKFKDLPHFQKIFGYDWRILLKRHVNKDFIKNTTYVNI